MRKVYNILIIIWLPFFGFSQSNEENQLENAKPNIYEFTQETSLLQSFSSFIRVDEIDPRIKYMYQQKPYQRSINMSALVQTENQSDTWYKYNDNPETFAQRQQKQINEAVKVFSQDNGKTIQLRVEEGFQNNQFTRFNRFNSNTNRNPYSFYYPQRNVELMINLSDD